MGKRLSAEAVAQYRRDGFYFPLPVLSAAEACGYRDKLEAHERATGGPIAGGMRHKVHLLFTWADELVRHPDHPRRRRGRDRARHPLLEHQLLHQGGAQSPAFVSWHQDATYWGLSTDDVITAWVAFADAHARQRLR